MGLMVISDNIIIPHSEDNIFDEADVSYTREHLIIQQLQPEIRHSIFCEYDFRDNHDTANVLLERDYQAACKAAIKLIRSKPPISTHLERHPGITGV